MSPTRQYLDLIIILIVTLNLPIFTAHEESFYCMKPVSNLQTPECVVTLSYEGIWSSFNATCLEQNVFAITYNESRPLTDSKTHDGRYFADLYEEEVPPYARISCKSLDPMTFDFEGLGSMEFFNAYKSQSGPNLTFTVAFLATPDTTGKYIISSAINPTIQTSVFIWSETSISPTMVGAARRFIPAIRLNETSTLMPCVASHSNSTVTIFQKTDNNGNGTWTMLNETNYDPFNGFTLTDASIGEYRCSVGADAAPTSPGFVTIRVEPPASNADIKVANKTRGLAMEILNRTTAVCYSTENRTDLKFANAYARNPTEAHSLELCLQRRGPYCGTHSLHSTKIGRVINGHACPNQSKSCVWITDTHLHGLLYCEGAEEDGDNSISQTYFTGLDNVTYTNVSEAPAWSILRPMNARLVLASYDSANTHQLFCRTAGFATMYGLYTMSIKYGNGSVIPLSEIGQGYARTLSVTSEMSEFVCNASIWNTNAEIQTVALAHALEKGCDNNYFACANQRCTMASFRCDGDNDCGDFSDEVNCSDHWCKSGGFDCGNGVCIQLKRKCNNVRDCSNGADESAGNCDKTFCGTNNFKCASGQCLSESTRCNWRNDCLDGSDERNCTSMRTTNPPYVYVPSCTYDQFKCKNGICIRGTYRCDGDNDCTDRSDEEDCSSYFCLRGGFNCTSGNNTCVVASKKCDNIKHCDDGSDESFETCSSTVCSSYSQTKCASGQCISVSYICDGIKSCYDNSDESDCERFHPSFVSTDTEVTFSPSHPFNELRCEITIANVTRFRPTISWWRRGHDLSATEPSRIWKDNTGLQLALRFSKITPEDSGEYICIAVNHLKKATQVFNVKVDFPTTPATTEAPTVEADVNQLHGISEGDSSSGISIALSILISVVFTCIMLALIGLLWRIYTRRRNLSNAPVRLRNNHQVVLNGVH